MVFEELWRRMGLSVDWTQTYQTIDANAQRVSQLAFLRNLARGEAYQSEAPTLWDVTFRTAVAQAELEDRERPGAYHRIGFPTTADPATRVFIETTRPGAARRLRRPGRAPRRRAVPAAVRLHRHDARLRRGGARRRAHRWPIPRRAPASR